MEVGYLVLLATHDKHLLHYLTCHMLIYEWPALYNTYTAIRWLQYLNSKGIYAQSLMETRFHSWVAARRVVCL